MRKTIVAANVFPTVLLALLSYVVPVGMASAQTSTANSTHSAPPAPVITGIGQQGYLSRFSGATRIQDSNMFQSSDGNLGIGTTAPIVSLHIFSNNPVGPSGYGPITLWTESGADNAQGAIYAVASSPVGGIAVNGEAYFGSGTGVIGQGNGNGVIGTTGNATDFATGVTGNANATTGPGVGVFGQNFSAAGLAGLFINRAAGNIIEGRVNAVDLTVFRVDGTGRVFADGGFQPNGADFAESMAVSGDRGSYAAGDLLVIDPASKRHLGLAQEPYSTLVAGIYSTKPGMLGSTRNLNEGAAKRRDSARCRWYRAVQGHGRERPHTGWGFAGDFLDPGPCHEGNRPKENARCGGREGPGRAPCGIRRNSGAGHAAVACGPGRIGEHFGRVIRHGEVGQAPLHCSPEICTCLVSKERGTSWRSFDSGHIDRSAAEAYSRADTGSVHWR